MGGQGGQWPGGGEWQPPSDHTQYSGPPGSGGTEGYDSGGSYQQPQAYDQPGLEQYDQPQAYDQYNAGGYTDPYSAPPAYQPPYSAPPGYDPNAVAPVPAPQKQNNTAVWIIGGVAVVVVLLLAVGVGVWALLPKEGNSSGGGPSGGGTEATGDLYAPDKINNACDLVGDLSFVSDYFEEQSDEPEHREQRSDYSSSFTCRVDFESDSDAFEIGSFDVHLSVQQTAEDGKALYEGYEESAKGLTGTGYDSGDIEGIGEKAYYHIYQNKSTYSSSVDYKIGVLDKNMYLEVRAYMLVDERLDVDEIGENLKKKAEEVLAAVREAASQ